MTRDEIIDGLEIYTVGGLKKNRVHITVEELQKFIDAIKALSEPTIKALEDVRAEVEALGTWHDKVMIETVDINRVLEVIDDKIEEIKHDR